MSLFRTLAALFVLTACAGSSRRECIDPGPTLDEIRVLVQASAAASLPELLGFLDHPNPRVRLYAAEALHRALDPHRAWSTRLEESRLELFRSTYGQDTEAGKAYITIATTAVPSLARALKDNSLLVRATVAATLAKLGVDAAEARDALREAARDEDPIARYWIEFALSRVDLRPHADLWLFHDAVRSEGDQQEPLSAEERAILALRIAESPPWLPETEGWGAPVFPDSPDLRFEAANELVRRGLPQLVLDAEGVTDAAERARELLVVLERELEEHFTKLISMIDEGFGFGIGEPAYKALIAFGDASVPHVTHAFLRSPRFPIGAPTYLAHLALMEELGPRTIPCLVDGLLHFRSDFANEQAAFRLASFGEAGLPALPFVLADWRFGGHEFWDRHGHSGRLFLDFESFDGRVLASFGPRALPYIEAELEQESDPTVRRRLIQALGRMGDDGLTVLERAGAR